MAAGGGGEQIEAVVDGRVATLDQPVGGEDVGVARCEAAGLDRGRGSALMDAYADVRIVPSAEGTLVSLASRVTLAA